MRFILLLGLLTHTFYAASNHVPFNTTPQSEIQSLQLGAQILEHQQRDSTQQPHQRQIQVFISYVWPDNNPQNHFCLRIAHDLRRAGIKVITAIEDNLTGQEISRFIHESITKSDVIILAGSKELLRRFLAREGVIYEEINGIAYKYRMRKGANRDTIIPILLDGSRESDTLPSFLWGKPWIGFRTEDSYDESIKRLINAIHHSVMDAH